MFSKYYKSLYNCEIVIQWFRIKKKNSLGLAFDSISKLDL